MSPVARSRRILLFSLALALALVLTGCGGAEDTAGGGSPATTGAEGEDTAGGTAPEATDMDGAADATGDATPGATAGGADDGVAGGGGDLHEVCQGQDGSGLKVGFANIGESVPFAVIVRQGIEAVAEACNLELVHADNALDPQQALSNARNFVSQDVDGVVEFQVHGDVADALCDILGELPSIAIDIAHDCSVFMGANNRAAGELTGQGAGERVQELWDCEVDEIITFEAFGVGQVNIDRLNGSIAGLQTVCPDLEYGDFEEWDPNVEDSIITRLDADRVDPAFTEGRDYLTAHPDADRIVALCINEDSCLGFQSAVEEAGREGQVIFASNGADPTAHEEIRNNEFYAGATAFFPERYGELIVPNIIRMINGEEPESDPLLVEHVFVSADNIDDVYPADAPPIPVYE